MNRTKRAVYTDKLMTIVFYCIAGFFFALLVSFAGYVIMKGFTGADATMFRFARKGSIGNQLFTQFILYFYRL